MAALYAARTPVERFLAMLDFFAFAGGEDW
jgi:hypothetical protein